MLLLTVMVGLCSVEPTQAQKKGGRRHAPDQAPLLQQGSGLVCCVDGVYHWWSLRDPHILHSCVPYIVQMWEQTEEGNGLSKTYLVRGRAGV